MSIIESKQKLAKMMMGLPYYWGEFSGKIESHDSDETKVVVVVQHQRSGEKCRWIFDAEYVYRYLLTIRRFRSWEEYYQQKMIDFASEYENLLKSFRWPLKQIQNEMTHFCSRYKIQYKDYCSHA